MDSQLPIELRYNDDLVIRVAGSDTEILSFLNLDTLDRDADYKPPFSLETAIEGAWQPVVPTEVFLEDIEGLANQILDTAASRGDGNEIAESGLWIPESFDAFWEEVLAQLNISDEATALPVARGTTRNALMDTDIITLLKQNLLSVQIESRGTLNTRLSIPEKDIAPGKIHFLAFNVDTVLHVDVKATPRDQVQLFIGPADAVLTCSTNQKPLADWEKSTSAGYYRCHLNAAGSRYGVVLFNQDPGRSCNYSLMGACGASATSMP